MKNRIFALGVLVLSIALMGSSCEGDNDYKTSRQQERALRRASAESGLPEIQNFTEKKLARMLMELRDEQVSTYTYISDNQGLHFVCNSIGYGMPYSTQYTNPQRYDGQGIVLPQAEPNGLFMPESAEATWVICDGGSKLVPLVAETRLVTSPFQLKSDNLQLAEPKINYRSQPLPIPDAVQTPIQSSDRPSDSPSP